MELPSEWCVMTELQGEFHSFVRNDFKPSSPHQNLKTSTTSWLFFRAVPNHQHHLSNVQLATCWPVPISHNYSSLKRYCDYFSWCESCTAVVLTGFVMCGCVCVFCNVWVCVCFVMCGCVCVGFVMCGCVYVFCNVWVCVCFVMCGCVYVFCNVWVCVCVGFVMCGCVYVWVL